MLTKNIYFWPVTRSGGLLAGSQGAHRDTDVLFRDGKCPPRGGCLLQEVYDDLKVDKKEIS